MGIGGGWVIVLVTAGSREEAKRIARHVVEKKLAACVNIVDNVESIYWWEGRAEEASESILVIKTRYSALGRLVEEIKSLHSYSIPEIIALPILAGLKDYMKWLDESVEAGDY